MLQNPPSNENNVVEIEKQLRELQTQWVEAHRKNEPTPIDDYQFKTLNGTAKLSELFENHDEMIVIHNMGKSCIYCSLWLDGFTGFAHQFNSRAAFIVTSPDDPQTQEDYRQKRGWNLPFYSIEGTEFAKDLGFFDTEKNSYWPGMSTLFRREGQIFRKTRTSFGPGDLFCSLWQMFDLLPEGAGSWKPQV